MAKTQKFIVLKHLNFLGPSHRYLLNLTYTFRYLRPEERYYTSEERYYTFEERYYTNIRT
jgi:hypothetical protein